MCFDLVLLYFLIFFSSFFPSTIEWYETIFGVFVVTKFWFFGRVEAEDSQGMGATSQLTVTYRLEIDGCQQQFDLMFMVKNFIFSLPESETASIIQGASAVKVERSSCNYWTYICKISIQKQTKFSHIALLNIKVNVFQSMSSENYVFACDGKTFNLIRSKVNTPLTQYRFPNLMFELWKTILAINSNIIYSKENTPTQTWYLSKKNYVTANKLREKTRDSRHLLLYAYAKKSHLNGLKWDWSNEKLLFFTFFTCFLSFKAFPIKSICFTIQGPNTHIHPL